MNISGWEPLSVEGMMNCCEWSESYYKSWDPTAFEIALSVGGCMDSQNLEERWNTGQGIKH